MNTCIGKFYDGQSTRSHDAVLKWGSGSGILRVVLTASNREFQFDRSESHIDTPLGSSAPRMVEFTSGARFYSGDDHTLAQLYNEDEGRARNPHALASRLERHKHAVLMSIMLLVVFLFAGYRYGVPAVADSLAFKLPVRSLEVIGNNTLETLDRYLGFKPTQLEQSVQERYELMFQTLVDEVGSAEYRYTLQFRRFGMNAFALPSGGIIVGDELITAMPDDEAVLAVFAHELAHVEARHGTRQLLRDAGIAFLIGSAFGDLGSGAGVFAALPKMLITSGYSRKFETEADLFAAEYMHHRYGTSAGMVKALETLGEALHGMEPESLKWISSHPLTQKRIQQIRDHEMP